MRPFKRTLLSTVFGLLAAQPTLSADLPYKAGPVQYLKICTLYGDGFYYIQGSDTCIRFGGYVRSDFGFNVTGGRAPHYSGAAGAQDRSVTRHSTRHRGTFQIDTRTQTPYGTLRTFHRLHLSSENEGTVDTQLARAFIQWSGFTFGRTASFMEQYGAVALFRGLHQTQNDSYTSAGGTNQIAYTWQLGNGVTLNIGADERRVRPLANWSAVSTTVGADPTTFRHGNSLPNPWVVLRVNQEWGNASFAVVANRNQASYYAAPAEPGTCTSISTTPCGYPDDKWGWAIIKGIEVKLPFVGLGDRVGGYFNYGVGAVRHAGGFGLASPGLFGSGNTVALGVVTDAAFVNGSQLQQTTAWSTGVAYEHLWTRNFSTTVFGNHTEVRYGAAVVGGRWFCGGSGGTTQNIVIAPAAPCDPSFKYWTIGVHTDWYPLPDLRLAIEVMRLGIASAFSGQTIILDKAQGSRPTGAYLARDLGITSVIFRAQRNFGDVRF